jgi:hypothetical protein
VRKGAVNIRQREVEAFKITVFFLKSLLLGARGEQSGYYKQIIMELVLYLKSSCLDLFLKKRPTEFMVNL